MNKFRKSILIGVTALSLGAASFTAHAFNGWGDCDGPGQNFRGKHGWSGKSRSEFAATRQTQMHDLLKLSAEQEPSWKAFTAAMTPLPMGQRPDRAGWENMSAPDRMEQRLAFMKNANTAMETRLAAMKAFYATLTPEQQKIFNDNFGRGQGRGHPRRWR